MHTAAGEHADDQLINNINLIQKDCISRLSVKTYAALADKMMNREILGFYIEHTHLLDSKLRREVIDLNQLFMYNTLYLKVHDELNRLVGTHRFAQFYQQHGPIDKGAFDIKMAEFLENISQQVIVAELFKLTIRNASERETKDKEKKVQGFVYKIMGHLDVKVFKIVYMQEESLHQELITKISGIISRYYYLSEVIEGMGIPLFEVIENAQKENQKFALGKLYPKSAVDDLSMGMLSDPVVFKQVLKTLEALKILVRCAWIFEESTAEGQPVFVIKIGVYNKGQLNENIRKNIENKANECITDKTIEDYFTAYNEEEKSAGIGLPMVNFLMEEFQQKGVDVKFSIYNASKGDNIIAEMNFTI